MSGFLKKILLSSLSVAAFASLHAETIAWSSSPEDGNWYNAANWVPAQVPNGSETTAVFDSSSLRNLNLPENSVTALDGIVFMQPASVQYDIELSPGAKLTFSGDGIRSEVPLGTADFISAFSNGSRIEFHGHAAAGKAVIYNVGGGEMHFYDQSSGEADYNVYAENQGYTGPGGLVVFHDQAAVGASDFVLQPGSPGNMGGEVDLNDDSTADQAVFTLIGDAILDISGHNSPGVTLYATLGDNGAIFLGSRNLTYNPPSTLQCLASLREGGKAGGHGGSLTKIGPNNLVLHRRSTYTGGTTVLEGTLTIYSQTGSATGRGPVEVTGGTLAGIGIIEGTVMIGDDFGTAGELRLIKTHGRLGTLVIHQSLTFAPHGIAQFEMDDARAQAGNVAAEGVTIERGAQVNFRDRKPSPLPSGTSFTLINNTSSDQIDGSFANLPEGSTFVVGPNTYRATYEGGDGNDLTITVE